MNTAANSPVRATRRTVFFHSAVAALALWLLGGIALAFVLGHGPKNEGWQWVFFLGVMGASEAFAFAVSGVLAGISLARRESKRGTAIGLLAISCVVV